jgi:hypothetical protein
VVQPPLLPQDLRSVQVLARFSMRMIVLSAFAAFGSAGFGKSFVALLWMSGAFSAIVGAFRRERPADVVLNHWDEAAAYAALFSLAIALDHAASA